MALERSNVVVSEPLCLTLELLDIGARWPWVNHVGPRMLAALAVSMWNLQKRYRVQRYQPRQDMAEDDIKARDQRQESLVQEVLESLRAPGINYEQALKSVVLTEDEVKAVAAMRRASPSKLASPIPYPLWAAHCNTSSFTKYQDVKRLDVEGMGSKLIYTGLHPSAGAVFIKFVNHPYPKEVRSL